MVPGLLLVTAYVVSCSPTLTFCIVKGTYNFIKYISDGLVKKDQ